MPGGFVQPIHVRLRYDEKDNGVNKNVYAGTGQNVNFVIGTASGTVKSGGGWIKVLIGSATRYIPLATGTSVVA